MEPQLSLIPDKQNFESIKRTDENGIEYWTARELMPILGYARWENSETVIKKAITSCINNGESSKNHFRDITKMINVGKMAVRKIRDYHLDRYACYLIAQNGDPSKEPIAKAQTYFAIQTRRQELIEQMSENEKRLYVRGQVASENKRLFSTAKQAGVTKFGSFNDAGYRGLYGMPLSSIEKKKQIKKGELLDRAGTTELAANLFRITQTDEKLKNDKIKGQARATQTHFMIGGKVRQTIKDIGGTLPERLVPEPNIKLIKSKEKSLKAK